MKQITAFGFLLNRGVKYAVLSLGVLLVATNAFGSPTHDFNLIAFGDLTGTSEVEGRTLVFGDVKGGAKNFGVHIDAVSQAVTTSGVSQSDALIVGGKIKSTSNVNNGGTRVRGKRKRAAVNNSDYVKYNDSGVTEVLDSVRADINEITKEFDNLAANSTFDFDDKNKEMFYSTPDPDSNISVFDVDASFFREGGTYDLAGDLDADLFLFKVTGIGKNKKLTTSSGLNATGKFNDDDFRRRIVWYFPELDDLTLSNGLGGAVIAPTADLTLGNFIAGSVVANNVTLNREIHLPPWSGLPPENPSTVPEPATALLFGFGLIGLAGALRRRAVTS